MSAAWAVPGVSPIAIVAKAIANMEMKTERMVRMGLVALPSDAAHGVKAGPGPAPTVDLDGVGVEPDPARYSGFTAAGQRRTLTDFPGAGLRSPSQGTCAQSATGRAFRQRTEARRVGKEWVGTGRTRWS